MICTFCNQNNAVTGQHSHSVRLGPHSMTSFVGVYCLECWIKSFEVTNEVAERLRKGERIIEYGNCDDCKKYNKSYCEKCVD